MRFEPISPAALADRVAEAVAARGGRVRVIIDGPEPAEPGVLADAIADRLRVLGRAPVRVRAVDYLRPASLRFERGRTDPDARYDDWLDTGALRREVLAAGDRVLPALWDAETDRSVRAAYVDVPGDGVVLLDGALLLGRDLPAELTVHLAMSAAALRRRGVPDWELPAFARYEREVDPLHAAGIGVRCDDPKRPAVLARSDDMITER
ncbi:uridine kinase [Labedaea rhizosphaerae]|uniref:Uridine kinase n=1 Tax=Labedaea rhizosphaerae TaxID=598644 RepID=A0A4R6SC95_LABRH|nr:uridine kinase [Labedaea rhizosphaerae]TDP97193.1 hypothetical protein EV186_103154 [Labedaea rhizosphaerae]